MEWDLNLTGTVLLIGCVTLSKFLWPSEPQFASLQNEDNSHIWLTGFLWELKELVDIKHLTQCHGLVSTQCVSYCCYQGLGEPRKFSSKTVIIMLWDTNQDWEEQHFTVFQDSWVFCFIGGLQTHSKSEHYPGQCWGPGWEEILQCSFAKS